ncbi:MAG: MoaD/ThiS family protein [Ferruginibacter sp.]
MKINILFFGQLTDITGIGSITMDGVNDTAMLTEQLARIYPELETTKYVLAINNEQVTENTILTGNCTVALLPPFSGG